MLLSRAGPTGLGSKTSYPLWASVFKEDNGKILSSHLDMCEHQGCDIKKSTLRAHGYAPKVTQISLWQNSNSLPCLTRVFMTHSFLTFGAFPLTTHRWHSIRAEPCPTPWPHSARSMFPLPEALSPLPLLAWWNQLTFWVSTLPQLHRVLMFWAPTAPYTFLIILFKNYLWIAFSEVGTAERLWR